MKKIILTLCLIGMIASFTSQHSEKVSVHDAMPPTVMANNFI